MTLQDEVTKIIRDGIDQAHGDLDYAKFLTPNASIHIIDLIRAVLTSDDALDKACMEVSDWDRSVAYNTISAAFDFITKDQQS